jgi:hypothetical protein
LASLLGVRARQLSCGVSALRWKREACGKTAAG